MHEKLKEPLKRMGVFEKQGERLQALTSCHIGKRKVKSFSQRKKNKYEPSKGLQCGKAYQTSGTLTLRERCVFVRKDKQK